MDKRIKRKMELLNSYLPASYFTIFRIFSSCVIFILLFIFSKYGYVVAPLVTLIYYLFLELFFLDYGIMLRKEALEEDALEYFNIFMASLKSNKQIRVSLEKTCNIVKNNLSREIAMVLNKVSIGVSLNEELEKYLGRVPSNYVRNIFVSIIEANKMGNCLNDSILLELKYIDNKQKKKKITRMYSKLFFTFLGILLITGLFVIYVILIKEILLV